MFSFKEHTLSSLTAVSWSQPVRVLFSCSGFSYSPQLLKYSWVAFNNFFLRSFDRTFLILEYIGYTRFFKNFLLKCIFPYCVDFWCRLDFQIDTCFSLICGSHFSNCCNLCFNRIDYFIAFFLYVHNLSKLSNVTINIFKCAAVGMTKIGIPFFSGCK